MPIAAEPSALIALAPPWSAIPTPRPASLGPCSIPARLRTTMSRERSAMPDATSFRAPDTKLGTPLSSNSFRYASTCISSSERNSSTSSTMSIICLDSLARSAPSQRPWNSIRITLILRLTLERAASDTRCQRARLDRFSSRLSFISEDSRTGRRLEKADMETRIAAATLFIALIVVFGSGSESSAQPTGIGYKPPTDADSKKTILLKDFHPDPALHDAAHEIPRAKFPLIDVHTHTNDAVGKIGR